MKLASWLETNNYQETTRANTLRGLALARRCHAEDRGLPASARYAVQRALTYHEAVGAESELDEGFVGWARGQGAEKVARLPKPKPKRRKYEARSMVEAQWRGLRAALGKGKTDEDRVLYATLITGLRIGDVLRTPREVIARGLKSGVLDIERKGGTFVQVPIEGIEAPWQALLERMRADKAGTVAALVCPDNPSPVAGQCAYKRCQRHLELVCAAVGVDGRHNLHRLRRTMAVQALKSTKDIVAVQQLLGHASVTSTQRYLDEIRVDDVARTRKAVLG